MQTVRRGGLVLVAACLFAVLGTWPSLASAAGGGGDDARAPATPAKADDPDYTAGVAAIQASDFAGAVRLLENVVKREPSNADAYNWLAYATRKGGDAARAIPIYEKALAIDPKHRGAHEYIGEAYLILGNLDKAREHLKKLDSLCFFPCSEYTDLKKAVQAYEAKTGKGKSSEK